MESVESVVGWSVAPKRGDHLHVSSCCAFAIGGACRGQRIGRPRQLWCLEGGFGVASVAPSAGGVAGGRHGPGIILRPGLRLVVAVALEAVPLAALGAALGAVDLGCLESREFLPESRRPGSARISTQIRGFAQTIHS